MKENIDMNNLIKKIMMEKKEEEKVKVKEKEKKEKEKEEKKEHAKENTNENNIKTANSIISALKILLMHEDDYGHNNIDGYINVIDTINKFNEKGFIYIKSKFKKCKSCNKYKKRGYFTVNKHIKDGKSSICRKCQKNYKQKLKINTTNNYLV